MYFLIAEFVNSRLPNTNNEALDILEESKTDNRIGLLIWCFGRMGLWSVLQNIYENVDDLKQAQYQGFIEKTIKLKSEAE